MLIGDSIAICLRCKYLLKTSRNHSKFKNQKNYFAWTRKSCKCKIDYRDNLFYLNFRFTFPDELNLPNASWTVIKSTLRNCWSSIDDDEKLKIPKVCSTFRWLFTFDSDVLSIKKWKIFLKNPSTDNILCHFSFDSFPVGSFPSSLENRIRKWFRQTHRQHRVDKKFTGIFMSVTIVSWLTQ